jgi:hypothetical protein
MNLDERRRFVRIPCQSVLEYTLLNENGTPDKERYGYVHCKNVSLGGILFTAFESFHKGTPLQLKLHMDCGDHHFENVTMSGHVIWSRRTHTSETWDVAIRVIPMKEEEKSLNFFNWLAEKDEQYFLL